MVSSITSASHTQPAAVPVAPHKPAQSKPQPAAATADSVQLSSAAQARLAAMQEATETSAQTAKEASGGDLQAQRLQAREAAAKSR
jgi:hypothetical protein